jgi:SAM-dependent methyltransferase
MKNCNICGGHDYDKIYAGTIRAGTHLKMTSEVFDVIQCEDCKLASLSPFPKIDYSSPEYRELYNDTSDVKDYISMHDHEQTPRISKIGIEIFRDKVVADLGCGGGSFLDSIRGVAKKTIGIEPFSDYHSSLKQRGHLVYPSTQDSLNTQVNCIDIITSFGVIEHTENPLEYLNEAYSLLKKGGKIYLETDNLDDFLMKMNIPEFEQFFYRTAHFWYFERNSLRRIMEIAGFNNIYEGFRHGYDLSNAFMWMKDRVPTGTDKVKNISSFCNDTWKRFLEESGKAELLHFSAVK